jgi:hypothetical protein
MTYSSAYAPPTPLPQGGERGVNLNLLPSPPWGRGWREAPGEGVTPERIGKAFPEHRLCDQYCG